MRIEVDKDFWQDENDEESAVFQYFPDVHMDGRGYFLESWKLETPHEHGMWIFRDGWMKQMNTSCSGKLVLRGCHAQSGESNQAKLVSAQTWGIFDVITDARPMSDTFKKTKVYFLNPKTQNRLFVPHGFLHAFITGPTDHELGYVFNYMCDNTYSSSDEINVCPIELVLPAFSDYCDKYGLDNFVEDAFNENRLNVSKKDIEGRKADDFFDTVKTMYSVNKKVWYR